MSLKEGRGQGERMGRLDEDGGGGVGVEGGQVALIQKNPATALPFSLPPTLPHVEFPLFPLPSLSPDKLCKVADETHSPFTSA